jgi:UDP-N-acetylglucosamine 2-epimerase (non-hydrolysing)
MKIATVLGTRPEIIKLSRIINQFDKFFDHKLIHTGQNYDYELNKIFFDDLKIRKPNFFLNAAGKDSNDSIGNIIIKSSEILKKIKPDALFILGDTNSGLSAISAKKLKIPIFHFEAGNRCFDMNVPEEINRKIIDHISDINITYSKIAKEYLVREGIHPKTVIKLSSPMKEVLQFYKKQIDNSEILKRVKIKKKDYILVSYHREENVDDLHNIKIFLNSLKKISKKYKKKILISTHYRFKKNLNKVSIPNTKNIIFLKPLGFFDYINLMKNSFVCLSDSGTITEEASILNIPAINLRDTNERPEGMESGITMMTGSNYEKINKAIKIITKSNLNSEKVKDYEESNVSTKIVKIVLSYEKYINKYLWQKK